MAGTLSVAGEGPLVYEGKDGPGKGKHIVFLAGDEEYRSEECIPMLARILAVRHGFKCTVLFTTNPADGTIDPCNLSNIPGIEALDNADMAFMFLRFRDFGDKMKHIVDFVNSGKPILGIRTSTHAFNIKDAKSPYAKYSFNNGAWPGGFGQQVLGETWVNHHGNHGKESQRGIINPAMKDHPILRGVEDIWAPTDVYTVTHLPPDAKVLVHGQVLEGMKPEDKPLEGPKNNPMMPIIWLHEYKGEAGKTTQAICSTIGSGVDFQSEGLRRVMVNACYWALGLADKIPAKSDVSYVGDYKPTWFGFGKFTKGIKPADLALPADAE
ncbi:MAG: ThuA domain-containing protein [Planctomycetota bacterium]|nr:ThuA domain-containing protein [Planctomycetota bacterium]